MFDSYHLCWRQDTGKQVVKQRIHDWWINHRGITASRGSTDIWMNGVLVYNEPPSDLASIRAPGWPQKISMCFGRIDIVSGMLGLLKNLLLKGYFKLGNEDTQIVSKVPPP